MLPNQNSHLQCIVNFVSTHVCTPRVKKPSTNSCVAGSIRNLFCFADLLFQQLKQVQSGIVWWNYFVAATFGGVNNSWPVLDMNRQWEAPSERDDDWCITIVSVTPPPKRQKWGHCLLWAITPSPPLNGSMQTLYDNLRDKPFKWVAQMGKRESGQIVF